MASTLLEVDAGLGLLQRDQRRQQRAGAGEQDERRGDLRDREQAQPPVRAGRDSDAAARQAQAGRRIGGRQPRDEGEHDRRHQRQADADPEQRAVDAEIERANGEARRIPRDHRQHRPRDQHAERGAGAAQQHAFGEQGAPQRSGARAEGGANRQLAFAAHRAREDQVRDVRARDDEDQS